MKRIILLLVLFCLCSSPCLAGKAEKEVKKGNRLYKKGKFSEALTSYKQAFLDKPDSDIVNYDLGAALYKSEDYKRALEHFQRSLVSEDEALEQKASYNVGNAKYKYGIGREDADLAGAIGLLKEALRHYKRAIELNAEDKDAKYNYEFVKKELERLEKKQEQQQQKQQQKKQQQQKQKQEQEQKQQQAKEKKEEKKEEEKEPEEQQQQQEQRQQQQPDRGKEEEQERAEEAAQPEKPSDEMSDEEALRLLESYHQEEEPRGLYKQKMPAVGLPDVLKDW